MSMTGPGVSGGEPASLPLSRPFRAVSLVHKECRSATRRILRSGGGGRLVFVVRGRLAVEPGGTRVLLNASEAFLIGTPETHRCMIASDGDTEYYLFSFRVRTPVPEENPTLTMPDRAYVRHPERIIRLIRMFENRGPGGSREILQHLLVLLLCAMIESARPEERMTREETGLETIASRVDACIAARYPESIVTTDIASELHYSPQYLERVYRAERRMSIREAVGARRIHEARAQILLRKNEAMEKIARQCGFSDVSYFRRVFKKETSMTPGEYRMTHGSQTAMGGWNTA